MNKAIFLDRDGVISKSFLIGGKSFAPRKFKDFKIFSSSAKLVKRLKLAGYMVFVVTNQPDVGKKLISKNTLKKMHNKIIKEMEVDQIYSCVHSQNAGCYCRKPKPGMILKAAKKYNIDLKRSFMVGDRASDIKAGLKAKCRSIFLDKKYKEQKPKAQEATFSNLAEATQYILKQSNL